MIRANEEKNKNECIAVKQVGILAPDTDKQLKLGTRNIIILGIVSLFIDMSTEMVYPIMPLFLAAIGTAPAIIGLIEGISESIAAFLRVGAGYVSDKTDKKKLFAIVGYSAAFFYKIGIYFSTTWVGVLASKIVDRTGKGLRVAPRDSLIAESGGKKLGRAYGLHKTLDMLGSALGALLAFVLLYFAFDFKSVFLWSLIPAAIGVLGLFFVKEMKKNGATEARDKFRLKNVKLDKKVWLYLLTIFIFSIGNSSNAFLLLKAQAVGIDDKMILLVYFTFNVVASLLSIPFGKIGDKHGRKPLIVCAYAIYGVVYLLFTLVTKVYGMFLIFALYGVYSGMLSGTEKALIVEISPKHLKGTVLGLQGMAQGFGLLLSSLIAGVLWQFVGNNFPFWFGGATAFFAAILMIFVLNLKTETENA